MVRIAWMLEHGRDVGGSVGFKEPQPSADV